MHCKYKQKKKSLKTNEQKKILNKKKERQLQQTTKMNLWPFLFVFHSYRVRTQRHLEIFHKLCERVIHFA